MAKWEVNEGTQGRVYLYTDGQPQVLHCELRAIARKLNAFDEMLAELKEAQAIMSADGHDCEFIAYAIAKAEGK